MLSTEFPFDVFISYGGENRAFARRLAGWLRNIQVKVWLDEEQLVPGCRWRDSLKQGLRDSRHLVAVLTPEYVSRPWTQRELDLFDLSADHAQRRLLALEMGQVPESPLDQMFEVTQRIKWQNADFDPEAFWCLSCGLRNCAPSPRNTWAERGKALLSEVHPQQIYGEPLEPVDYFLFYEPTLVAHRNIIQMAFAHAQGSYSNLQSCVSEVRDLIKSEDRNTLSDLTRELWAFGYAEAAVIITLAALPTQIATMSTQHLVRFAWPFIDLNCQSIADRFLLCDTLKGPQTGEIWFSWAV